VNELKKVNVVKEEIETEKVITVRCDFCQKEFDKITVICKGYGQVKIKFGYGSKYDGDIFRGEICDDCFDDHFKGKLRIKRVD